MSQILNFVIISDKPDARRLLHGQLTAQGHAVEVAFNLEEALRLIQNDTDLVAICDLTIAGVPTKHIIETLSERTHGDYGVVVLATAQLNTQSTQKLSTELGALICHFGRNAPAEIIRHAESARKQRLSYN